jgi:hypothetical protein
VGTSKAYGGISGNPNWSQLSRAVTSACDTGDISVSSLDKIAVRLSGLIGEVAHGGRDQSLILGKSGIRTAQRLVPILSSIKNKGFSTAIANIGLKVDGSTTPNDVVNFLLEYCADTASTLDDTAAKGAERTLLEEICAEAKSLVDLEQNFKEVVESFGIEDLIIKYYAYYIYEHLSIGFYEKLITSKGKNAALNFYSQLKDFLVEKMRNISKSKDLTKTNWSKKEGKELINNIFWDTIGAFDNYED